MYFIIGRDNKQEYILLAFIRLDHRRDLGFYPGTGCHTALGRWILLPGLLHARHLSGVAAAGPVMPGTHVAPVLTLMMLALLPLPVLLQLPLQGGVLPLFIRFVHHLVPLPGCLVGFPFCQKLLAEKQPQADKAQHEQGKNPVCVAANLGRLILFLRKGRLFFRLFFCGLFLIRQVPCK